MKSATLRFEVSQEDGWLVAVCEKPHLATQARTIEELVKMIKEAIACQFDDDDPLRSAKPELVFHKPALAYA